MADPEESFVSPSDEVAWVAVQCEMADVLIYLLRLSDVLSVDLESAVRAKLAVNEGLGLVGHGDSFRSRGLLDVKCPSNRGNPTLPRSTIESRHPRDTNWCRNVVIGGE